ncbi:MAG: restriction endonuclease [Methylotenera sp.]|nr:restriction endonuclease [Methylotenera sp.]
MAIPDFQSVMLPLLDFAADQKEHSLQDTVEALAAIFGLTIEEREELLPSGKQARFDNRVAWARSYFKQAGLVENTRRGFFRISQRGIDLFKTTPKKINIKLLEQYPEFIDFRNLRKDINDIQPMLIDEPEKQTPEEQLENSYKILSDGLASEIIQLVKSCSPSFFERLVVELLLAMGYGGTRVGAGRAIGQSGDGGIDGIIDEDRLGLDSIYIQAKRWEGVVGRPEIQKFVGALSGQRATKGVFITTSDFTREALDFVKNNNHYKVVLINGFTLAKFMIENNVGVSVATTYQVKKIDTDYFVDE